MEYSVTCNICGKKFITIGHHIKIKHGVSIEEYLKMYPNATISSEEFLNDRREKVKKSCNTEEFRSKMSEIGYKNNSRPERRKQSSEILKSLNKNPEFRELGIKAWKEKLKDPVFYKEHSELLSKNAKEQWSKDYDNLSKKVGPHIWKSEMFEKPFRSFAEMFLAEQLLVSGIQFSYEKHYFKYYCSEKNKIRKYNPDFYLTDYDLFIEVKYKESVIDKTTAEKIKAVQSEGKQIILVFHNDIIKSPSVVSYILNNNIQPFIDKTNQLVLRATTIESIDSKKDTVE